MTTLSKVAAKTKSISKWVGVLILIFIFIQIAGLVKERLFPSPKPLPTVSFGKLQPIEFPKNATNRNFSYSIDTLSGNLPVFSDRIAVYKINSQKPDLLAFERTKTAVANLGFSSSATSVSQDTYRWEDQSELSRKLTINIFFSDFTLTSSFLATTSGEPINIIKNKAIDTARSFLQDLSLLPNDLDSEKTQATLFYKKNYILIPVSDIAGATDIKVDFFQSNVNKIPIFYPNALSSTMNFLVENIQNNPKVVSANFVHQEISQESATYPIKTPEQAFTELKEGKAYISSYSGNDQNIPIKDVFLAYYIGDKRQNYLYPIVVFQGNNDFFAYVPAITNEWVGN